MDGVISSAAALTAVRLCPYVKDYILPSHLSAEPVGRLIINELGVSPILHGDMRLGERTLKATKEKKNLLRTAKKVTRNWQITVKNNKETAVDVVVEDQIPVATNDDAKVTLLESSNAKVDEKEGRLKWTLHLAPGEKKELNINYEVKVKDEFLFDKLMSDQEL